MANSQSYTVIPQRTYKCARKTLRLPDCRICQIAEYKVIIFMKIIDYSNFLPLTAIFRCYLEDYYSAGPLPDYGLGTLVDKVNQDRQKIPNRRNDFGYVDRAYIGKGIYNQDSLKKS